MMILHTLSEKISDTQTRVYWRVGTKRKGILDVTQASAHEDSALIGELIALQHLLFEKVVFTGSKGPGSGIGYKLVVSKGAIKKLATGRSDKKYAMKFAAFLTSRMKGVAIEVSQKREFMPTLEECEPELLVDANEKNSSTFDQIETPAMGTILVTQHAVDQYEARITSGSPKRPWASLVSRLMHPEMRQITLPPKVQAHKIRKYGQLDEFWSHPTSRFQFVVTRNQDGKGTLVTVVERDEP